MTGDYFGASVACNYASLAKRDEECGATPGFRGGNSSFPNDDTTRAAGVSVEDPAADIGYCRTLLL